MYSTCLELVELDPMRQDWLHELAYGHHNLAALAQERGNWNVAETGFSNTLEILKDIQQTNDTAELRIEISDVISWLGNIARTRGEMERALGYFQQSEEIAAAVWEQDTTNATSQRFLAYALSRLAKASSMVGAFHAAIEYADRSTTLLQELLQHDPSNREMLADIDRSHLTKGFAFAALGQWSSARRQTDILMADLTRLRLDAPDDFDIQRMYADTHLLRSLIEQQVNDVNGAMQFARLATDGMQQSFEADRLDEEAMHTLASSYLVQAELYAMLHDESRTDQALSKAEELLQDRVGGSSSPFLAEPWARLLYLSGRLEEGDRIREMLEREGFRPIRAWPRR